MVEGQQPGRGENVPPNTEAGQEVVSTPQGPPNPTSRFLGRLPRQDRRAMYIRASRETILFHLEEGRSFLPAIDPNVALTVEIIQHVARLEEGQQRLNAIIDHSIQPIIRQYARMIEVSGERDSLPAAASAQYEWYGRVTDTRRTVENMIEVFDDLPQRLSFHVALQRQMADLLKLARLMNNPALVSAALTVHDVLYGVYSEDLTLSQAQLLEESVSSLRNVDWDRERVRELDRVLRRAGFETLPSDKFMAPTHVINNS